MMKPKYQHRLLTTIRFILGIIFLVSGIGKLIDGAQAQYLVELMATELYWLIEYSNAIVISTSVLELLLAIFLLWGKQLKWAFGVTLLMFVGLSSVLFYFYLQGMNVEGCGCFGAFGFSSGLEFTLLRNLVLMVLVVSAYLLINYDKETE